MFFFVHHSIHFVKMAGQGSKILKLKGAKKDSARIASSNKEQAKYDKVLRQAQFLNPANLSQQLSAPASDGAGGDAKQAGSTVSVKGALGGNGTAYGSDRFPISA